MKREEANNFLTKIEEEMPSIEKKKFLSYAAVVENSKINNDFIIELGICLESAGLLEFHENLIDVVYEVWNSELIRKKIKEEQIIAIDCGLVDKLDKDTDGDDCCVEIRKYKKYQQKLEGGLSISNVKHFAKSGTLGCIFKLKGSKAKYAITNAHVVDYSSCKHNHKTIMHPSKSDSTFSTNIEIGNIHWICDNEYVDASIIELKSTIEIGKPLRCSTLDLDIPISPVENMTVIKCGRSTGLTQGSIRSIKCCLFIYNDNGTIKKRYRDQIITSCMACKGDSGSVLVQEKTGHVVGLIFAKSFGKTQVNFANIFTNIFSQQVSQTQCKPQIEFDQFI